MRVSNVKPSNAWSQRSDCFLPLVIAGRWSYVLDKYIKATDISSPSQNGRQIPVSWQKQPVGGHHKNQNLFTVLTGHIGHSLGLSRLYKWPHFSWWSVILVLSLATAKARHINSENASKHKFKNFQFSFIIIFINLLPVFPYKTKKKRKKGGLSSTSLRRIKVLTYVLIFKFLIRRKICQPASFRFRHV